MKKIIGFLLFAILIIYNKFFYLIEFPFENSLIVVTLICILAFFLFTLSSRSTNTIHKLKFSKLVAMLFVLVLIEMIISYINYMQGIQGVLGLSYKFFILLLYFPLSMFTTKKDYKKIKYTIIASSLILSVLFIIQFIIYDRSGTFVLKNIGFDINSLYVEQRYYGIRLTNIVNITLLGILFSYDEILNNFKDNIITTLINISSFILCMIYIVVVAQTRMVVIGIMLSLIFMTIFKFNSVRKVKILGLIFIPVLFCMLINTEFINTYIESFNNYNEDWSYIARIGAIKYYLIQGFDNMGFGAGFPNIRTNSALLSYIRGPYGIYYIEDVGIIGFFSYMGILGVIWYILLLSKLYKLCRIYVKRLKYCSDMIGLLCYVIFSTATLFIFDSDRTMILPILLFLYDYYFSCSEEIHN